MKKGLFCSEYQYGVDPLQNTKLEATIRASLTQGAADLWSASCVPEVWLSATACFRLCAAPSEHCNSPLQMSAIGT